ncbi:MmgE/PrpD family protein [Bordetella sp. BOR01]|uniref:MmgE/PrpD family protein n=1 Tax=Bordetella sp. BOR01 TaxID=2854779 RepID=UPI001C4576FB|nr:MmgE/PrpD family protein [Bordetella sp. BOR01]MBV7485003.1 MmgE/PrpD family protein [Bordetella sp. BOR01]
MTASLSRMLGQFVHDTRFDDLPDHVVDLGKACLLDALGTAYAARHLPVPGIARRFVGHNAGRAVVIAGGQRVPAVDAAFVNATLVNGCTHDDFLQKSHPGAVVVPAALAVADEQNCSGAELLTAIVLGYDLVARAYLGGPGMLPAFRATGVAGAIGAAGAAARLLGLSAEQTAHALGCAAMFASGFGEGFRSGTTEVKLNVGWASRSGVSAAQLAQAGATTSPTVFEGESGYYQAFARTARHADAAVQDLGERFLIEDTVYKERPVCVFVQTPVQLAHQLASQHQLDAQGITRVTVRAPELTLSNPGYQNVAPYASPLKARISARFTVAAALLGRPVDTYAYYDNTGDGPVLALAEKIHLLEPEPGQGGRVDVQITCNGVGYSASGQEMDTLKPTADKVVAKFRRLTADLAPEKTERLLQTVLGLQDLQQIDGLSAQLETL